MKMSVKRSVVLATAVMSTFGIASMARASIAYDVQALSVTGPGLTLNNAHSVTVTATGGTINFGVFADINNGGAPDPADSVQTPARGYVVAGLPTGSGSVAGNNGPDGNMTNADLDSRFTGNGSVGPVNGEAGQTTTANVDLNGNGFSDFGNLTLDDNLDIIPRGFKAVLNSKNGTNGSNFQFFFFSMPITSLGTAGGTTLVSFFNNGSTADILYTEKNTTGITGGNVVFGPSLSTVITAAGGVVVTTTHSGLGSAPTNTLTTPGSITITTTPSGYKATAVQITPVATGSIALSDITGGLVEVLIHANKTLTAMGTSVDFPGGTATDLTLPGLDADAKNLLSFYPWANILIRYPATTSTGNDFFNFDVSGAGATVDEIVAVPEPASLGLMTIGGLALLARRRKVAK